MLVNGYWNGRRVLVTGHTGFKGGWLSLWLDAMGAQVTGLALAPVGEPNLFSAARIGERVHHIEGDIRDPGMVALAFETARPEVVFHLAAQALVRESYREPVATYATNVMGTVHVLDEARRHDTVRAIVAVTSDKCYENREWTWPYRENEPMGGYDPYSSSKGCAELAISAWRRSYFSDGGLMLASARAGNVIGGGDWSADRLVPDLVRAYENGKAPLVRSPNSVRPWQHVLEALRGYLMLTERLLDGERSFAEGWNFGPSEEDARPVSWIVARMGAAWGDAPESERDSGPQPHEAGLLRLDCSKARTTLGWQPTLALTSALDWIVSWHKAVAGGADAQALTLRQIADYRALTASRAEIGAAA